MKELGGVRPAQCSQCRGSGLGKAEHLLKKEKSKTQIKRAEIEPALTTGMCNDPGKAGADCGEAREELHAEFHGNLKTCP